MHFHIRTALPSDYPAIYQLNKEEMGYDYPLEETKAKLAALLQQEGDQIFVAVAKGLVVGYLHLRDYDVLYAPHMKDVMGIAVSSRYQRMGIGRALLETGEKWAIQNGAKAIRLVSGEERTGAHAFYRRCGYTSNKSQINFRKYL